MKYSVYTEQSYLDCDLDCDPEDAPVATGNSLFNITKSVTLLFIVQSLLHCNPSNIWIKIIPITIQIKCLHWTKFLNLDRNSNHDPDNFAPNKMGRRNNNVDTDLLEERGTVRIIWTQDGGIVTLVFMLPEKKHNENNEIFNQEYLLEKFTNNLWRIPDMFFTQFHFVSNLLKRI